MAAMEPQAVKAMGTDDAPADGAIINPLLLGRTESVTTPSAGIGYRSAFIGKQAGHSEMPLTLVGGSDRQQKPHPTGMGKTSGRRDSNPRH